MDTLCAQDCRDQERWEQYLPTKFKHALSTSLTPGLAMQELRSWASNSLCIYTHARTHTHTLKRQYMMCGLLFYVTLTEILAGNQEQVFNALVSLHRACLRPRAWDLTCPKRTKPDLLCREKHFAPVKWPRSWWNRKKKAFGSCISITQLRKMRFFCFFLKLNYFGP